MGFKINSKVVIKGLYGKGNENVFGKYANAICTVKSVTNFNSFIGIELIETGDILWKEHHLSPANFEGISKIVNKFMDGDSTPCKSCPLMLECSLEGNVYDKPLVERDYAKRMFLDKHVFTTCTIFQGEAFSPINPWTISYSTSTGPSPAAIVQEYNQEWPLSIGEEA